MSHANPTHRGSTATIGARRSTANIVGSVLLRRRPRGIVLQAACTLAASAVKAAISAAALAATATLAAVAVVDKRSAASMNATARLTAAVVKGATAAAALSGTAALAAGAIKTQFESAALSGSAAMALSGRGASCQVANSNGDRVVNSDGSVAIDYQYA